MSSTMAFGKNSVNKGATSRRVPNAFMIFVKEKNQDLLKKCSDEEKASMGAYLGKKWKSMSVEEKKVYFEKYEALKALKNDELDSDPSMVPASSDEVNMKPLKKVRRPPNAFMIFAKEHRHTLSQKDKTNHTSTILGNMWRDLTDSQKEKYFTEARRLSSLYKMSEPASSNKILKRKKKIRSEIAPEKPMGRRRKKKKKFPCTVTTDLQNEEINSDGITEIESNSTKSSENVENTGIINTSSEPQAFSNYQNLSHFHQNSSAMSHLHHMPSSVEPSHSNPCCSYFHNGTSSCQNLNSGFPGMSRSCLGPSSFSPLFSSYPFNVPPPWMYHQSVAHQWLPYPSPNFYPSPYSYYMPYSYNNAYNSYVNYYETLYSRRVAESSSGAAPNSNPPATAASASIRENSAEAGKTDESYNDDQLVVDEEDSNENEPQEDGTD